MAKILDDQHFDDGFTARRPAAPSGGNPLAAYFRVPGVHVPLPTGGVFMPPGSIELTMDGKVAVYPMRAADEMLLKSPDALMNGYAIEKLLESCVPAIKAPRLISSPDLDVILLAIRAATMGEVITINPVCPECGAENESHRHLASLMETMTPVPAENCVRLTDEVVVYVRPHNLEDATRLGIASFEETRKIQALEATEADQTDRAAQMSRSMTRLSTMSGETTADCIVKVVIPNGTVTDRQSIREFAANISKTWTKKITEKLSEINNFGVDKHYDVVCPSCQHAWKSEIEFNPSTFFDDGSSAS